MNENGNDKKQLCNNQCLPYKNYKKIDSSSCTTKYLKAY